MRRVVFPSCAVGLSDLLRVRELGDAALQDFLAEMLGYAKLEKPSQSPSEPEALAPSFDLDEEPPSDANADDAPVFIPPSRYAGVPFWQPSTYKSLTLPERGNLTTETPRWEFSNEPAPPVPFLHLASDAAMLTQVRKGSPSRIPSREPDVPKVIEHWGRGRFLERMPRRPRKSWGRSLQVLVDRAGRLAPYWDDQDHAISTLRRVYPRDGLSIGDLADGDCEPLVREANGRYSRAPFPKPGAALLVLGDLGCLAPREHDATGFWRDMGCRLREQSIPALALLPCRAENCPEELRRLWTVLPWESDSSALGGAPTDAEANQVARDVLALLAFCSRIEPQLIRLARRLFDSGRRDAGIEARVWRDEALRSRHPDAAGLDRQQAAALMVQRLALAPALRQAVYREVEARRRALYPGLWYAEVLGLEAEIRAGLIDREKLEEAQAWYEREWARLGQSGPAGELRDLAIWHRRILSELPSSGWKSAARVAIHRMWKRVHAGRPNALPPSAADPVLLGAPDDPSQPLPPIRWIELRHVGDQLVARFEESRSGSERASDLLGSPITRMRCRDGRIKIEALPPERLARHDRNAFWEGGAPPPWASDWGWDQYGAWAAFRVEQVTQRMRWIPPGRFQMGSPKYEEGRFSDEGPRHEEVIASGFCMLDTPCTQALWEAVMGDNPSQFKGPDRPVEQVSWDDCQQFVQRLNERLPGLKLSLPSESRWEYACRAGTEGSCYGELDDIAWYDKNSGGSTHPVATKTPNAWGLYDMLGNVWEWCTDAWRSDYSQPAPAESASASRVIRGGSWYDTAQDARAASRDRGDPSGRLGYRGFRCVEFQEGVVSQAGRPARQAERAVSRSEPGAEHPGGDREPASAAAWLQLANRPEAQTPLLNISPISIRTDVEEFTLRREIRPPWASAIGRDRFGLWAEFSLASPNVSPATTPAKKSSKSGNWKRAKPKKSESSKPGTPRVRQRLRWIPPGWFLMGYIGTEEGRRLSEGPRYEKRILSGFWIFDTPCTQSLWEVVMGVNPSFFKGSNRPVEQVSWEDCQRFVGLLNERLAGLTLALPSEAQWEYACRAGTEGPRYGELGEIAWYDENSGDETHTVATKAPNPWGLYDMLGNVWEWCADEWRWDYSQPEQTEASSGASTPRAVRGGSWFNTTFHALAAYRDPVDPSYRVDSLGFRCAEFQEGV